MNTNPRETLDRKPNQRPGNYLLWAVHNLGVTNICERTIYVVIGEMKEINIKTDV